MQEYLDVGVGIRNQVNSFYPLEWVESDVTGGIVVMALSGANQEIQIGDHIGYQSVFIVRYTLPLEIRSLEQFERNESSFSRSQKRHRVFKAFHEHLENLRGPNGDSILLSNKKEGEALMSIRFSFGIPGEK